jgi:hypothetical protein
MATVIIVESMTYTKVALTKSKNVVNGPLLGDKLMPKGLPTKVTVRTLTTLDLSRKGERTTNQINALLAHLETAASAVTKTAVSSHKQVAEKGSN